MGGRGSTVGQLPGASPVNVNVLSERVLTARMRNVMNNLEARANNQFPGLGTALSENFASFRHVTFDDASVLGTYNSATKTIDIANRTVKLQGLTAGGNTMESVMAHELGHALSQRLPSGYKGAEAAFDAGYNEYRRSNRGASQMDFATSISAYAGTSKREAFAEAFSDVLINGSRAKSASHIIMNNWRN